MSALLCLGCKTEMRVIDVRPLANNQALRRRRECKGCGKRVTTYERLVDMEPAISDDEFYEISRVINRVLRRAVGRPE